MVSLSAICADSIARVCYAEKHEPLIWISEILIGGRMLQDQRIRRLRLRDLHILDVVADAGSMARAAPRLAMSQPAVSRVIAEMEHALGVPISTVRWPACS